MIEESIIFQIVFKLGCPVFVIAKKLHTSEAKIYRLNLTWEDVNFDQKWVRLWTCKRKGGELQDDKVVMSDTLYQILKRRWNNRIKSTFYIFHDENGSKFTYYQKGAITKGLCKKAGVKYFGFHAIRHHVASILADSGKASLSQIQKILRHQRISTTDNYINTLDPQLRQIVNILDEKGKFNVKN